MDGNWAVEGEGVAPDIEVHQEPSKILKGKDPQLEKAVDEALRLLKVMNLFLNLNLLHLCVGKDLPDIKITLYKSIKLLKTGAFSPLFII